MRAKVIHDAYTTATIAEGNQFLSKKHEPHGCSIIAQFARFGSWNPILSHEVTHDSTGSHSCHINVVLFNTHKFSFVYKLIKFGELV